MSVNDHYVPQAPALMIPTARSGVESELSELERARQTRNPISSVAHRIGAWSSKKALEASARKFGALKEATDKFTAAARSRVEAREVVMMCQAQQELLQLRHEFAIQQTIMDLHIAFNERKERLHAGQRGALIAHNGVEAAGKFREVNLALGLARKEAAIAETVDVLPQSHADKPSKHTATLEDLFRIRTELRADARDTSRIDDAINETAVRLGIAAE